MLDVLFWLMMNLFVLLWTIFVFNRFPIPIFIRKFQNAKCRWARDIRSPSQCHHCYGNSCTSHCSSCCRHLLCVEAKNVSQKHHFHFFFMVVIIVTIRISYCNFYCRRGFFKSGIETDRVELQWKIKRWKGLGRANWPEQSKGDGGVTCCLRKIARASKIYVSVK